MQGGGMGGITTALTELLGAMGLDLPPWGMPAIAVALMILLLPWILKNMKTTKARKLLKKAAFERNEARERMEREALDLVSNNPTGLLAFADECIRRGRYPLARQALDRLPGDDPKMRRERRRLMETMAPREPATAAAAAVTIERFLDEELHDEARRRLDRARKRWPEDALLRALAQKL
ncbi:MAG: hypothetical protein AAFV53_07035 [Myxococcota bacterium]